MAFLHKTDPVAISANPATITSSASIPAGSLIILDLTEYYGGSAPQAVASVVDDVNTGAYSIAISEGASGFVVSAIFYKIADATGTPTVTVTFSGAGTPPGTLSLRVFDGEHTVLGPTSSGYSASTTTPAPGAVNPSGSALYLALYCPHFVYVTLTNTAGWTQRAVRTAIDGSGPIEHYSIDTVTTGSQNPVVTLGAASEVSCVIASFEAGDVTAPSLSSASASGTGSTTADLSVTTDEGNGTLRAVVTTSATAPSAAQVQAGQDHTGGAAAWAGSQSVSSTGSKTLNATGLGPATSYWAHFQHEDSTGNDSTVASSAEFKTYQRAVPVSDVSAGTWAPSTGASLYAVLDETAADDADYISTQAGGDACVVAFGTLTDPVSSAGHKISYRLAGDGASGIEVALMQGATVIATWTHNPAPTGFTTYEQTLTGTQADSITDYTALRLRFTEV